LKSCAIRCAEIVAAAAELGKTHLGPPGKITVLMNKQGVRKIQIVDSDTGGGGTGGVMAAGPELFTEMHPFYCGTR
jgi:hypothetical protein